MKNPIKASKMFVTPRSEQDLYDRIQQFTGTERALAFHVAMMTMNLCHDLVQKEVEKELTV
jgi:hypothetical protein